jgi:hypothetical protein
MSPQAFLDALGQFNVSPFQVTAQELEAEIDRE